MNLSVTLILLAFSLYLTHPCSAASDGEGWSWGGDDDEPSPDPPTPKPTPRPTTTRTPPNGGDSKPIDCVKQCPRTPQYNPVCGTDNITYRNEATLKCSKNCGLELDIMHLGKCQEAPAPSTVKPTTLKPSSRVEACITNCPKLPQYNPICGTDGVTYNNDGLLSCAKNCGKSVEVEHRGKCPDSPPPSEIPPTTSKPRPTPTGRPRPTPRPTEDSADLDNVIFKECLNECPSTLEFKPVCGSDGVTYANKGVFNCQVKCGKRIEVSSNGKCASNGGASGSTQRPNARLDACLKKCPSSPQYNPICGTNNQTYRNEGLLKCAQNCGVDVNKDYLGACPKP